MKAIAAVLVAACAAAFAACTARSELAHDAGPGFRTPELLDEHYRKHGAEFGGISKAEYLRRARALRDAPPSRSVLQAVHEDGVITKFDRRTGDFLAYNPDRTIRTFFIPNDGERYFHRQARRYDRR